MQPYVHISYYSQTATDSTTEQERLTHARVSALNDLPSFPQGDIEVDHVEQVQSRQLLAHRATDGWPLAIRTEVHLRVKTFP